MTQPDEATIPGEPQKAHGDALEELVEASPDDASGGADRPVDEQPDA